MSPPCPAPAGHLGPLPWIAAGLLLTGCTDSATPCATLCRDAQRCRAELATALTQRVPQRSAAGKRIAARLRQEILPALLQACPDRCTHLRRTTRLRHQMDACLRAPRCGAFARCAAPLLEP